jgi:hypothetical protein
MMICLYTLRIILSPILAATSPAPVYGGSVYPAGVLSIAHAVCT